MAPPQVPHHFYGPGYDEWHRWISYWYQIQAVSRANPKTVLEVGVGNGLVAHYLRSHLRLGVTTLDHDPDLTPDVVGDVRNLKALFAAGAFDSVCAFQVLEHLPYESFMECLAQLSHAAERRVILSLPHAGYFLQARLRVLRFGWGLAWGRKLGWRRPWRYDGQHHWELGTREHSVASVSADIASVLRIERQYFCPDYPYHYYFECAKR